MSPTRRTAWVTLRHQPPYRSDAFADGFETLGFKVKMAFPETGQVKPEDVVVTWNLNPRYRGAEEAAKAAGAALIIAENGYIAPAPGLAPIYALARDGHNGSGYWFVGDEDRWSNLRQTIEPWVDRPGGYILIPDQRGIGSDLMRCPRLFYESVKPKIARVFAPSGYQPELRLRTHPGRHQPQRCLEEDLAEARAVVTWGSNVANIALLKGIPTYRCAPYHVNEAALSDLSTLPDPPRPDRLKAFKKLAWAQWTLSEIESGLAFKTLLRDVYQ